MPASRHLFRFSWDDDLPPLPGCSGSTACNKLQRLLEALIETAGANIIPAPALAPDAPDIGEAFARLRAAAERYEVAPGVRLAEYFWTHGSPFHSGLVGAQLAATVRTGHVPQGFLALHATEVRSPLLYGPNMQPIRVQGPLNAIADAGGPYLALVVCEGRPHGRADAVAGFAMPVYHSRRFLPVRSDLDRDVLRALEHLQQSLDAHGAECAVQRIRPLIDNANTQLMVTLTPRAGLPSHLRVAVDPNGGAPKHRCSEPLADYTVTHRNWQDGSFVARLERTLMA